MKKLNFFFILLLLLFQQTLFSQNYFGQITDVDLNRPQTTSGVEAFFGLESINTDYLDIAITQLRNGNVYGQWNLNNDGTGTFTSYSSSHIFNVETTSSFTGNLFVKLHSSYNVKDLLVCRSNGLEVHWNQNGNITGVQQNFTGTNWKHVEQGVFSASDLANDVIVSNETNTISYFINNCNGYLQNSEPITLPHSVYNFKLCQLNDKTDGYVQNDPDDRSDIIFIDRSHRYVPLPDMVYAYLNDNNNNFNTVNTFTSFSIEGYGIADLEVADLDNDGFNDLILICDVSCPGPYYARVYKNAHGEYIDYNNPLWTYALCTYQISCSSVPKVNVTDLNKDGLNDLVFVLNKPDATPGFKALVFINQIYPIYSQEPQEYSIVDYEEGHNPYLLQATTADIYGGQEHDGGGIALLTSYLVSDGVGGSAELYIKVLNANEQLQQVAPPPPIVQKSLEYDHDNIWHPHLHLNNRGERDFDYYEIWKYKAGWNEPIKYDWPVRGTGWTDIYECVDASGQDNFFWNCYYFAKSVDNAPTPNVSIPSQIAYFTVGCVPVCDGCGEEDNPFPSTNQNHSIDAVNKTSLLSNYPNPFNPSTSIRFVLPKEAIVKITIYNCMGQVVKQLVNTRYKAGMHSVRFDGGNLASGIYYCLFETGDYRHTNKMLLIK